jgi:hypothetical protein
MAGIHERFAKKLDNRTSLVLREFSKEALRHFSLQLRYFGDGCLPLRCHVNKIGPFVDVALPPLDLPSLLKVLQRPACIASVHENQIGELVLGGCAPFSIEKRQQARLRMVESQSGELSFGGLTSPAGKLADQIEKRQEVVHLNLHLGIVAG